jgi:hypothetical protein
MKHSVRSSIDPGRREAVRGGYRDFVYGYGFGRTGMVSETKVSFGVQPCTVRQSEKPDLQIRTLVCRGGEPFVEHRNNSRLIVHDFLRRR